MKKEEIVLFSQIYKKNLYWMLEGFEILISSSNCQEWEILGQEFANSQLGQGGVSNRVQEFNMFIGEQIFKFLN